MAIINNIQKNTIGLNIELKIRNNNSPFDISSSTTKNIIIKRPDNTKVTRAASFTTDGTDGLLYCLTQSGDLSLAGIYFAQAYFEQVGFSGYSSSITFEVKENL